MNKKQSTILLTALLAFGSSVPAMASSVTNTSIKMPNFSFDNLPQQNMIKTSNEKVINNLTERKGSLEETIMSETFKDLSLGEKMMFVENYFTVRSDIHKGNQKTVLSSTDVFDVEVLKETLVTESDNQNKDIALILAITDELKTKNMSELTQEEVKASKDMMIKVVTSYKELRNAGRDLNTLINTQIKVFHSSQLHMLNKFGQKFDIEGDKEQALELNKKMLKLTGGDFESYKKVSNLMTADNKTFFYVDNEVVEASIPFLMKSSGRYVDVSDISKVKGFEIQNEPSKLKVENSGNVLEVNKEDESVLFNGASIGKNFTVLENGKLYLPIRTTFELFHYDVKWNKEIENIVIHKQVYDYSEIDSISIEDMLGEYFPQDPLETVKNN